MTVVLVVAIVAVVVVVLAWFVIAPTARAMAREGAARAREEERAELGAHLHDVVLQELLLIQKRAADPEQVVRLARHTERGLRAWLSSATGDGDDLVAALVAVVEDVEDRFAVRVEAVTSGTCRLDRRAEAVVGAAHEALTNAAKDAGVRSTERRHRKVTAALVTTAPERHLGGCRPRRAERGGQRHSPRDRAVCGLPRPQKRRSISSMLLISIRS